MATLRLGLYNDEPLSFPALCEKISDGADAERLVEAVLESSLSANKIELAAMALIHCGHVDLGAKVLEEKFQENRRGKFTNASAKDFAVVCAHLSLLELQKAVSGKDPKLNIEKANDLAIEAAKIDESAPMPYVTQAYYRLLLNPDTLCGQAQDMFDIAKTKMDMKTNAMVDLRALVEIGLGLALFRKEYYEEANVHFKSVLQDYSAAVPMIRLAIGQTFLAQKKDDAELAFKAALEKCPGSYVALTALALMKVNSRNEQELGEAGRHIKDALNANPDYAPALLVKSTLLFFAGGKHIVKLLSQAVKLDENNKRVYAEALYQLGRLRHQKGNLEDAKGKYLKAIERDEKHVRASFNLGLLALAEGKPEDAVKYCKAAEHELHEFFEFNAVMGLAYARLSQMKEQESQELRKQAIKYLETALAVPRKPNPTEVVKVRRTLGWLRIKSLEFTEAETQFKEAENLFMQVGENPDDELLLFLGIAQFQSGKIEQALETFSRCVNQENPILRFNTGRCLEELSRFSEAKELYNQLREDFPSFAEPLIRLAAMAVRDTRPNIVNPEAKSYLETVLTERDSCETLALLSLGNVGARCRQFREAGEYMSRAQEKASDGEGYLYATVSMGNYLLEYAQTKDSDKDQKDRIHTAQKFFLKALQRNCHCFAAANGMALCWLLLGHTAQAKVQLRVIKDYVPELSSSSENLGRAFMEEGEYSAAKALFEEANKNFYDKTDVNLLLLTYYACKGDKKFDECLNVAEKLCSLRPEYENNWYLLGTSLHKVVLKQSSSRTIDESKLREKTVLTWIRQMDRAAELLEMFLSVATVDEASKGAIHKKIESIRDQRRNRLQNLLTTARLNEEKRKSMLRMETEKAKIELDPSEDVPRPE